MPVRMREVAVLEEYVCVTVLSAPAESELDFSARLSQFWTHMLRNYKTDFEKVYAEKTTFEHKGNRLARQYLVADAVLPLLEAQFAKDGVTYEPVDCDDTYSKYEAVAPEWMQIEH
jgi:hypothetical protein